MSRVNEFSVTLPGRPIPKARPRFVGKGGHGSTYDKQCDLKAAMRLLIRSQTKAQDAMSGPLAISIKCYFKKPKAKQKEYPNFHIKKPDLDNLIKWICDIGNGILWVDDKQIVSIDADKMYGEKDQTVIHVKKLE